MTDPDKPTNNSKLLADLAHAMKSAPAFDEALLQHSRAASAAVTEAVATMPDIRAALEPAFRATEEMQRRLAEDVASPIAEAAAAVRAAVDGIPSVASHLRSHMEPIYRSIQSVLDDLPAEIREGLRLLAEAGWYFDAEMPARALMHLSRRADDSVGVYMASYFREAAPRIRGELLERHRARVSALKAAFDAHFRGEYFLSIPVFLAQADGISFDATGRNVFRSGVGPQVASAKLSAIEAAYWTPLTLQKIPLTEAKAWRRLNPAELNRHAVMHGESLAYGTEENSLKAISWLNYVSYMLKADT
ncbi:hypothetical protein LK996_11070 [Lysobacter sp. A6]|uniref:Uncharacterized protein n=1 Tax=Noviluteimonas lactosilytica TaxID=2888523 RepID=A0ABS8JJ77_9GAMM|nr:hypothetical protein [Lysobacter lactosilyticus]MCC8363609.1 hypothetical protein [Lysobacter lactosilyticus]